MDRRSALSAMVAAPLVLGASGKKAAAVPRDKNVVWVEAVPGAEWFTANPISGFSMRLYCHIGGGQDAWVISAGCLSDAAAGFASSHLLALPDDGGYSLADAQACAEDLAVALRRAIDWTRSRSNA